jgi:uncharacterized protein YggE
MRILVLLLSIALLPATARSVTATGDGAVSIRPDAARVTISIVKQAPTAAEAASQNATAATAVIGAVRQLLGANADVKTTSYNVYPVYNSSQQLTGFNAINTIDAVAADPNLAGRVVDAAIGAGATRVDGVRLFLRDDEAARSQALRIASQKARTRADAIALGLGVRLGSIISAKEGTSVAPIVGGVAATTPTPIETGTLEVRGTVTVEVEIVP